MRIFDNEVEIIKSFSIIWRKSSECCNPFNECKEKEDENYICGNDPLDFLRLPESEKEALNNWIDYALEPDNDNLCPNHSYSLKHIYERDIGNYVTNGQFKGAMIQYGFDPVNPRELNSYYRVKFNPSILEKFNEHTYF